MGHVDADDSVRAVVEQQGRRRRAVKERVVMGRVDGAIAVGNVSAGVAEQRRSAREKQRESARQEHLRIAHKVEALRMRRWEGRVPYNEGSMCGTGGPGLGATKWYEDPNPDVARWAFWDTMGISR